MISVYDYFDYRKYLSDAYKEAKSANPSFSYRHMGEKTGFSSAGFFTKIITGKTNISIQTAIAFTRLFKMSKQETRYFETLVQFNQAKSHESRKFFFEQLISFRQTTGKNLAPEQYELFSTWYYVVIRELFYFYPFFGDYKELASLVVPSIKENEARKAVSVLENLGLITKNPDGYYEQADAVISTGEKWTSTAIDQFQIDTGKLAVRAIRQIPRDERDLSTCTVSISPATLESIREKTKNFRKEILELARADSVPDRIYHLNIHLFPVSRKHRGNR